METPLRLMQFLRTQWPAIELVCGHQKQETMMKKFAKGQKVKNRFGETLTVLFQRGCQVFVEEECGVWYHPDNLYSIG
ncbi:MAG: hypothetical protein ACKN9T_10580 [Candidatus Methylumidiphilus sp.]